MIPLFSFVELFLLLSEILIPCEKLYILHCNYPLLRQPRKVTTLQVVRTSLLHPRLCLFPPPSPPPPPPPAPILLEKGCGQQEGINGTGKQTAEEKLDADNVGRCRGIEEQ